MFRSTFLMSLILLPLSTMAENKRPSPSNGVSYPQGWQNWAVISVSHRTDNNTLRLIIGNDTAVTAARTGNTKPWPDNSIIGKVVWKDKQLSSWPAATTPGKLVHAEFMVKNSTAFSNTYNWGWARWMGTEQKPFNKGMQSCISCHQPVQKQDWVFTEPASLP